MIALLALGSALAADVDWDLSQRWRRTSLLTVLEGESQIATVGGQTYQSAYDPTWFQRTRFSATIADKHAVQVALGTEADFKTLRQLAASYLGPRWMVGYERGSFPQRIELLNESQPGVGGAYDALLFPPDMEPQRTYSALRLRYRIPARGVFFYVGASWTTLKNPRRIAEYGGSDALNALELIDPAAVTQSIAPSMSIDRTRFVLAEGCNDAVYCVRFALEHEMALGFAAEYASEDARQRYAEAWRPWHGIESETIPPSFGGSTDIATSIGVLNVFDLGETARLGVELGVSGRQFMVVGTARLGDPTFASLDDRSVAGGNNLYIYYGPHIEAYSRF